MQVELLLTNTELNIRSNHILQNIGLQKAKGLSFCCNKANVTEQTIEASEAKHCMFCSVKSNQMKQNK